MGQAQAAAAKAERPSPPADLTPEAAEVYAQGLKRYARTRMRISRSMRAQAREANAALADFIARCREHGIDVSVETPITKDVTSNGHDQPRS